VNGKLKTFPPKHGYLRSIRLQTRKTNELVNVITAKFGKRIIWDDKSRYHLIDRPLDYVIYFRCRGNKFANWLEFLSYDVLILQKIKESFPDNFKAHDVETREGEI